MAAITADQVTKLTTILEQLDYLQSPSADNRRRARRLNVRMPLSVFIQPPLGRRVTLEIYTRNLSSSGMGFISRRHFNVGERMVIEFSVKDFPSRLILSRITYARYISSGLYEMGAEFIEAIKNNAHSTIPSHWLITGKIVDNKSLLPKADSPS